MKPQEVKKERIPLVGEFNTRNFWSSSASFGASGYVGLGIVGVMIVGATNSATQDQQFINAVPDMTTNPMTNFRTYYCYKRPGMEAFSTPASGSIGTAIMIWTGQGSGNKIISAFGGTNSTIYDSTTSLGTITGVATDISETIIGSTATLVIISDNGKAYYYQPAGAITEIIDVDYPNNAGFTPTGNFVHLDGYAFIMTTNGSIYNSDLNSIANWTSTSFVAANMYPDQGVGLARYKDLIVAFGRSTIEFYRDVGNALGSPLQRVPEAFIKIGAVGPTAITSLEDNIAWAASSETGSISIYLLDGYKANRISTDTIDTQIGIRGSSTIYLSSAKIFGKSLIFVQFGGTTFVYAVEDKMWHSWSSPKGILWHKWAANTASSSTLYSVSRNSTLGKIYRVNPTVPVYQDDGTSYTTTIQTSKIDFGTENRKFLSKFTLVGDKTTSADSISIQWSDDDYGTYNTARTIDLNSNRKYLSNLGSFRRRSFKIVDTSSLPFRLEAMELEYTVGMH